MAVSEAKKASNAAWDRENMVYQTVKVRKEILEEFRAACAARGDKVNTVLREAMEGYAAGTLQHKEATQPEQIGGILTAELETEIRKAAEAEGMDPAAWLARATAEQIRREALGRMLRK